jgi:DNA-binding Xre family transcriptional regulator
VKRLPAFFYELPSGHEPVREWIKSLDADDRKIIGEDIKDVEFSWPIGMPLVRALGKGLWEVRSDLTQGRIARVLFCINEGRIVARLRQEDTEDTKQRSGFGVEAKEGDHMNKKKGRIGSSFDAFLKGEGLYEEVTARAIKRVIARQLDALMHEQDISKTELAKRMKTSRAQLDRLLDPDNESVTLGTLARAAQAVGRNLRMELV